MTYSIYRQRPHDYMRVRRKGKLVPWARSIGVTPNEQPSTPDFLRTPLIAPGMTWEEARPMLVQLMEMLGQYGWPLLNIAGDYHNVVATDDGTAGYPLPIGTAYTSSDDETVVNVNEVSLVDVDGEYSLKLPPSPSVGDMVAFYFTDGSGDTWTGDRNGNTINTAGSDLSYSDAGGGAYIALHFRGNGDWMKIADES